jgi:S-DNA-T family DNA segregation ATPase FtsK/SpoIIIE
LGCSGILISSSSLTAVWHLNQFSFLGRTYPVTGFLGNFSLQILGPFLGTIGFVLLFLLILILSLMAAIRFSPYFVARKLVHGVGVIKNLYKERRQNGKTNESHKENMRTSGKMTQNSRDEFPAVEIKVHEPPVQQIRQESEEFRPLPAASGDFILPNFQMLDKHDENERTELDREHFMEVRQKLEATLKDFGVDGNVVGISPGPVITTYEFAPAPGVKISKVVSLEDDLALGLKSESVRIVGSVPGKAALGIEIPNPIRQNVYIREILSTDAFHKSSSPLTLALGKDVIGNPVYTNLADMPHLLIAGATGAGKSVGINTIICSILLKATPEEVRLLMIDPKRIELSAYEDIPHLLHPVVVDPNMASRALQWAVMEMERRYGLMEDMRVKNITTYNLEAEEKLPLIVIIIDELADLMMVASKDVECSVARLAQMARAAGMHLILATQRPSVDVLTGLIKANFPARMSFRVSSKIDSRTILDASGAEHLLGKGDMLLVPPGASRMQRIHGAYISENEIEKIVTFLKEQRSAAYDESVLKIAEEPSPDQGVDFEDYDEKYDEAVALVCESGQASISMVQRRLRVGYNRAARMIEIMEKEGIVGPSDGAKPREILARKNY